MRLNVNEQRDCNYKSIISKFIAPITAEENRIDGQISQWFCTIAITSFLKTAKFQMSNLIDSFKATNKFLSYLCICPLNIRTVTQTLECHRYHITYHILSLILYEIILLISAYNKFMHGVLVQTNLSQGSILITWIMLARSFTIGVILSLANRNNQIELFNKLWHFDCNLMTQLNHQIFYKKPIRNLVALITFVVIYNNAVYIILAIYYKDNLSTVIFYMCCTHADVYFSND